MTGDGLLRYRAVELHAGTASLQERAWSPRDESTPWVLLRPLLVGICGSDHRELQGRRPGQRTFGHEVVATVVASDGVTGQRSGTFVTVDPHVPLNRTTGFGELMLLRGTGAAISTALVALPSTVAPVRLVFTEPLACVYHTVDRIVAHRRSTGADASGAALVVGAGTYGTLIALALSDAGLDVTLVNRSRERLAFLHDNEVARAIRVAAMPEPPDPAFDLVVLASRECTEPLLRYGAAAAREGGVVVPFAATVAGQRFGEADLHGVRSQETAATVRVGGRRLSVLGCHGANSGDFAVALARLADPAFPPVESLVSRLAGLDELPSLLSPDQLAARCPGKVVVAI